MSNLSNQAFSNMLWKFFERIGAYLISFVVQVFLARMLEPGEFGIISMVTVFISIFNVFISNGLGTSLIQKKDADSIDFSTVLIFNVFISAFLYAILFICSPLIAQFYNNEALTPVLRVLGLQLILSGIKTVEQAYVARHLKFKLFFWATLSGTVLSGVLGVIMAKSGFGVWALVAQHLTNSFIDCIILLFTVGWKLKFLFSYNRLKPLISYGWKLLAGALFDNVYNNLRTLFIGKKYSSEDLAYFNRGQQLPDLIYDNIAVTIESVLFPVMSRVQDEKEQLREMNRRFIRLCSFIMSPLMVGLAVVADPLVRALLTEKWLPAVPYIRIYCFVRIIGPMQIANQQTIKAVGRSDIALMIEIIKKSIGLIILLFAMNYGVYQIALSNILYSLIVLFVNAFPCKKLIGYSFFNQVIDLFPSLVLSAVMGTAVYFLSMIGLSGMLSLIIQIAAGGIIYIGGAALLKMESFLYFKKLIKTYVSKTKNN